MLDLSTTPNPSCTATLLPIVPALQLPLKETLPVIKLDYEEVSERPTTTEHHGGQVEDKSTDENLLWDKEEKL